MTSALALEVADKALSRARGREPAVSRMAFSQRCKHVGGEWAGHPYDPNTDPIQKWILSQLDLYRPDGSRVWERFYWLAPPQFGGKTIVAIIINLLHGVTQDRVPVGYALPTIEALEKAWHSKLKPQIRKSGFQGYMALEGPGSKGGKGLVQQFYDPITGEPLGSVTFCTPGAFGDTIATMLVDEVDQFRLKGMPDLDGLEDLWNRCNSYKRRALRIAVGTLEWDVNSTILELVEKQGTCTRPWLKCPHCGRYQNLDPEKQLVYEGNDDNAVRESARLKCAHCPAKWNETDRKYAITHCIMVHKGQEIDAQGAIVGPVPETIALSVYEDAFVCPHSNLGELAREDWLSLKDEKIGSYGRRRKYFRYRLCRPYVQPIQAGQMDNKSLALRSMQSKYHKREVPAWVTHLTSGSDVQKDRHYWLVMGHGPDRRWCIIDWGFEYLSPMNLDGKPTEGYEPTPADRVRVMDLVAGTMRRGWARQGNPQERLAPIWNLIDVGYLPEEIVPWIASQPDWVAGKGVGSTPDGRKDDTRSEGSSILTEHPELAQLMRGILDVSRPASMTIELWKIQGAHVRQQLHSGLMRAMDSAASGQTPFKLAANDFLILHLTAEAYTRDEKTGNFYWREVRPGNHLLDCATYALAMGWMQSALVSLYPPVPPPAQKAMLPTTPNHQQERKLQPPPLTTPDGRPWSVRDRT